MSDDDEILATALLLGLVKEDSKGRISHTHLEAGSDLENQARAALARLLLNCDRELPHNIRRRLAALIDPAHEHEPRELVIQPRKRGRQSDYLIDVEIARDIAAAVNADEKIDAAVKIAAEKYGVSERTARRAWAEHRSVWIIRPPRAN